MPKKPLVASFDIATAVGLCCGYPGDRNPFIATWDLRAAGANRPLRLSYFANLCEEFFKQNEVDVACYEAPLRLAAMNKIGTAEDVMLLLRGAIGVFEAVAARARIAEIRSFDVKSARQHFIGQRLTPRRKDGKSEAKVLVMKMCKTLGFNVRNDNESDAVAGWHYTCALLNPQLAVLTTPLFARS